VKGPHAALAVRLQQRDPGRSFVLGERLQYVLLPGFRTQVHLAQGCARKSDRTHRAGGVDCCRGLTIVPHRRRRPARSRKQQARSGRTPTMSYIFATSSVRRSARSSRRASLRHKYRRAPCCSAHLMCGPLGAVAFACAFADQQSSRKMCAVPAVAAKRAAYDGEGRPFGRFGRDGLEVWRSEGSAPARSGAVLQGQRQVPGLPTAHCSSGRRCVTDSARASQYIFNRALHRILLDLISLAKRS